MAFIVFRSIYPKYFKKLKKRKYLTPIPNPNRLFDILAERGVDYQMNIPGSKFHNHTLKHTTAKKAYMLKYGYEVTADTYEVLLLEYDEAYCKNPAYLESYLLRKIQN